MEDLSRSIQIFKKSFAYNDDQQPMYMITRHHIGSYFAMAAAIYNLFLIRQRVIKNSIFLTKSNNPKIVKGMCFVVGSLYFAGLYTLWHIPSFFSEVAVRTYVSTQDAVTNYLLRDYMNQLLFNQKRSRKILSETGLNI